MEMIFYSPVHGRDEKRLQAMMEKLIPGGRTETYRTIDDLAGRLLEPHNDLTIAVLLAAEKDDLFNCRMYSQLFRSPPP